MTASPPSLGDSDGSSSVAARWMSGLGAFLLVAAAATFVAVRWGETPDEVKFGGLVALTIACIGADRSLRPRLPITASAVLHIGVLLVPVDVAAVGVSLEWHWPTMLLAEGLAVTAACGIGAYARGSVVLRAATWVGVVLLAGGVGAVADLPSGLILAAMALVAVFVGGADRRQVEIAAAGWATLAGLAVPLAAADRIGLVGAGVLSDLGLADRQPHPLAVVTGTIAALTLGLVAHRRRTVPVALLGVASFLAGATTTWVGLEPGLEASFVAVSALLLLAEAVAWLLRRDPFWAVPLGLVARTGELMGAVLTVWLASLVLAAPWRNGAYLAATLGASFVALTWIAAAVRDSRDSPQAYWPWTSAPVGLRGAAPFAAAIAAGAAGVLATDDLAARAVLMFVVAGASVTVPPPAWPGATVNRVLGAGLLAWPAVIAHEEPGLVVGLGLAGAVVVALATVDTARYSGTRGFNSVVYALVGLALVPPAATWLVVSLQDEAALAVTATIVGLWLVAALLDQATIVPAPAPPRPPWAASTTRSSTPRPLPPPAKVPRRAALVPLAAVPVAGDVLFTAAEALVIACVFGVLALVDVARRKDPELLVGVGCATAVAVASAVFMAEGSVEQASVALTLSGLVWLSGAVVLPNRWELPAVLSGAIAGTAGFVLGQEDPAATSANLVIVGSALVMLGAARRDLWWTACGSMTAMFGLWMQLALNDVSWTEPYVAPVALVLWGLGYVSRSRTATASGGAEASSWLASGLAATRGPSRPTASGGAEVSSWLAYAPAVALLGGTALLERLVEASSGWHGVIAGAVGIGAVSAGALWRQAGPLLTGTALVVAVTAHETLEVSPQVPTWAWLAAGGATLLSLGILLERRGTSPLETGRRLVDVVNERFS